MLWGIVLLVALLIPILAIIFDSPIGRSWARRLEHPGDDAPASQLAKRVERIEEELDALTRSLDATREEVQFLQRLLEGGEAPRLKPPPGPS